MKVSGLEGWRVSGFDGSRVVGFEFWSCFLWSCGAAGLYIPKKSISCHFASVCCYACFEDERSFIFLYWGWSHPRETIFFNGHMNLYKVGSIGTVVGTSGRSVGRRKDRNELRNRVSSPWTRTVSFAVAGARCSWCQCRGQGRI